ncbi:MAG: rRNA pseudouridine synthase [Oscillospiraceae bacterium]|nr:rRNA pseudouridine synthase [Oscillospiraceae bacterium]
MRIDKYISGCGYASRSEVKDLVKRGIVVADGRVCKKCDEQVREDSVVEVDGKTLIYRKYVYLMLNKPKGYVSAVSDKRYPPVTDFVPAEYKHFDVYPVGRLDIDTEGLLILTNDGQFAHSVMSPGKNVKKRYFACVDLPMAEEDIETFAAGMEFKEFTARPALLEITDNPHEVYIEIAEGKFHQVKRMCARCGKSVTYLKRVSVGGVKLDEKLAPGEMRELSKEEVETLVNY